MKIEHDGQTYEFDMDSLEAHELRVVEQHANMTYAEWVDGLKRGKVDALVALVFTAKRRAGSDVEWSDLDSLLIPDLMLAMAEANDVDLGALARGELDVEEMARSQQDAVQEMLANRKERRDAARKNSSGGSAPAKRSTGRGRVAAVK